MTREHSSDNIGIKSTHLISQKEPACLNPQLVGGKGYQLAQLTQQGFTVPPFAILSAELYADFAPFLNPDQQLPEHLRSLLGSLINIGINQILKASKLSEHVRSTLRFAVRSSAIGEDGEQQAYAGLLQTVIGVQSVDAIIDAVLSVWASLDRPEVTAYRTVHSAATDSRATHSTTAHSTTIEATQTTNRSNPRCAVILQKMLEPDVAGVLFTAHPQTGQRDHAFVEANYGLGESVVQPEGEVDQFIFDLNEPEPTPAPSLFGRFLKKKTSNKKALKRQDIQKNGAKRKASKETELKKSELKNTTSNIDNTDNTDKSSKIGNKLKAYHFDHTSQQVELKPIPTERQNQPCLNHAQLQQLRQLAKQLQQIHATPRDCEWAFIDQTLYLLQCRPITRLPLLQPPHGNATLWDNSNIQESYNGVTTPLSFSVASLAYAAVYEQTARIAGAPKSLLDEARPLFRNLIGYVHGHIYYNINHWIECLRYAPSFKRSKADMEKMMGVTEPIPFLDDETFTLREQLAKLPLILLAAWQILLSLSRLKKNIQRFQTDAHQLIEEAKRNSGPMQSDIELIHAFDQLNQKIFAIWHTPIQNDLFVMMMNGIVHRSLTKLSKKHPEKRQDESDIQALLSVDEQLASLAPAELLYHIAHRISQSPEARAFMVRYKQSLHQSQSQTQPNAFANSLASKPTKAMSAPKATAMAFTLETLYAIEPTIESRCQEYIERFGDRFMGEQKLETITPRQQPDLLIPLIANCLDAEGQTITHNLSSFQANATTNTSHSKALQLLDQLFDHTNHSTNTAHTNNAKTPNHRQKQKQRRLTKLLLKLLHHVISIKTRFQKGFLNLALKKLSSGIDNREAMRLTRTRLFGQYRSIFTALGKQWVQAGRLQQTDDIFFLTWDELLAHAESRSVITDYQAVVDVRRAQYERHKTFPPLKRQFTTYGGSVTDYTEAQIDAKPDPNQTRFQGTGCQAGVIEGRVRRVLSPDDALDINGTILCTLRTDPGWTPLFLGAKGVIVEQGTLLSHSAIIARELGLPTVVNIPHITQLLNDGDLISLDGQSGKITLLERADASHEKSHGA